MADTTRKAASPLAPAKVTVKEAKPKDLTKEAADNLADQSLVFRGPNAADRKARADSALRGIR